uniref:Globoside alpha-1,3-N-acetylgalactosaminyltransferase 1-like n=1 Tax=Amphiprion percula TaxID=161767 RepID=A0A3P8SDG5_AMPPE
MFTLLPCNSTFVIQYRCGVNSHKTVIHLSVPFLFLLFAGVTSVFEILIYNQNFPHKSVLNAESSILNFFVFLRRTDVNSVTNWNAPLVWEGTFDPVVIDDIYSRMNPRVAVVVLAVGKYTRFLKGFLESGEKYFLVGLRVTYYIFTDNEQDVPNVTLSEGRKITILPVPSAKRWQDVVLSKMKWATVTIDKQIRNEADYLFMMDVDSVFHNRFGAESLSQMSAVLHRGFYKRDQFPYERRPESKAYIPAGEGDYYYTAAVWGGYLEDMYRLIKYCYEQSEEDAKNNIEAVWQEESHLNKYFLYNKPAKVLSPEYLWSDYDAPAACTDNATQLSRFQSQ